MLKAVRFCGIAAAVLLAGLSSVCCSHDAGPVPEAETDTVDYFPPSIFSPNEIRVILGQEPDLSRDIRGYDSRDGDVPVEIDTSELKTDTLGYYTIKCSAEDKAGNRAERTVTVVVTDWDGETEAADPAEVQALKEETLDTLFPDGYEHLSERSRAETVYGWITENIRYRGGPKEMDILKAKREDDAVWEGLSDRHGNCYTFYAVSAALLRGVGLEVRRVWSTAPGEMHFWNLVRIDGSWLHFDTTPNFNGDILGLFLLTDEELAAKHGDNWSFAAEETPE